MKEDYMPRWTEFDVAGDEKMPTILGEKLATPEEAHRFINENLIVINQAITVSRHMDHKEITDVRDQYQELLEDRIPLQERDVNEATAVYNEAKNELKEVNEMLSASITEAKLLAKEAKRGTIDYKAPEGRTYRVPVDGKYYFYTYVDQCLKLCSVRNIPEHEKSEIFNAMASNTAILEKQTEEQNVETTA